MGPPMVQAGKNAQSYRERGCPMPPLPEAAPAVSRHLFDLFYQVEIRTSASSWRHPIASAKRGRECATIMAILAPVRRRGLRGSSENRHQLRPVLAGGQSLLCV